MSGCFGEGAPLLLKNSVQIALNYLERSGEIDDYKETCEFLVDEVASMIRHGQALSNGANHRARFRLAHRHLRDPPGDQRWSRLFARFCQSFFDALACSASVSFGSRVSSFEADLSGSARCAVRARSLSAGCSSAFPSLTMP